MSVILETLGPRNTRMIHLVANYIDGSWMALDPLSVEPSHPSDLPTVLRTDTSSSKQAPEKVSQQSHVVLARTGKAKFKIHK